MVVAILCTQQACAPHVVFPRALPRSAPYVDRLAWYQRFQTQQRTTLIVYSANGASPPLHRSTVDGQEIYHSEDLIPLVGRRSRVATHSRAAMRGEIAGGWTMGGGAAGIVLGSATMALQRSTGLPRDVTLGVGVSLLGAGGLAAFIGWMIRQGAAGERGEAFDAFDEDLRRRLGVCLQRSLELVDCDRREQRPTSTSTTR